MFDALATTVIRGVIDELVDVRQYSTEFRWLNRLGITPALDGEIFARYKGRIYAADIISLDGKAVIRSAPSVRLTQTEIPILKHGAGLSREMLRLIMRIEQNLASRSEMGLFANYTATELQNLILGVYTRMEALSCAMVMDGGPTGFSYNRLGITMTGVTWDMPADLKVTLTGADQWDEPTTAKPIANIHAIVQLAQQKYGIVFDRLSMSLETFNKMITTAEFQALARGTIFINGATTPLPLGNLQMMTPIAQSVLGIAEIEIDDRQFWTEANSGAESANRYVPANAVVFSVRGFDGRRNAYDFANAECEEAMPGMVPDIIGGFDGTEGDGFGPLGYATAASPDGNPPGLNMWAVASGFPRKHKEAATAVLFAF